MVRFVYFLLFLLTGLAACTDEANVEQAKELVGYWVVEHATRAEHATTLLNGTWFEFYENSEMNTNLQTLEGRTAFSIKKDKLKKEGRVPVEFTIASRTDSSLVLSFEMRSQPFELFLKKAEKAPRENTSEEMEPTPVEPTVEPSES